MSNELKLKISEILDKNILDYTVEDMNLFEQVDNLEKLLEFKEMLYKKIKNENEIAYIIDFLPLDILNFIDFNMIDTSNYYLYKNYIEILTKENLINEDIKQLQNIPIDIISSINPDYSKYIRIDDEININNIYFNIKCKNYYLQNIEELKNYGFENYNDFILFFVAYNNHFIVSRNIKFVNDKGNIYEFIDKNASMKDADTQKIEQIIVDIFDNISTDNLYNYLKNNKATSDILINKIINNENLIRENPTIIDFILENKLTDNVINYALNCGYIITKHTPNKIKNNVDLVKKALNNNDEYDLMQSLCYLEVDIFKKLFNNIKSREFIISFDFEDDLKNVLSRSLSIFLFLISREIKVSSYLELIPADLLNDDLNFNILLKFIKKRKILVDLFGKKSQKGKYEILENVKLIKEILELNCTSDLIDYISDDVLNTNPDIIDISIFKGYSSSSNSPKIIKEDIIYIRKLIERENNPDIYVIDYVSEEILKSNLELIDLAIEKGYELNHNSPNIIKRNISYIRRIFKLKDDLDVINYVSEEILRANLDLIDVSIDEGYSLSYDSPNIIKEDITYIRKLIERENNPDVYAIDYISKEILKSNLDLIDLAIEKGYELNHNSPNIVKNDINYVRKIFERKENPQIDIFYYINANKFNENKKIICEMMEKAIDLGYSNINVIKSYFGEFNEQQQNKFLNKLVVSIVEYYFYHQTELDDFLYKKFIEEFFYSKKIIEDNIDDYLMLLVFRHSNLENDFEWNILKYLDLKEILDEFNKKSQTKINIDVEKITNLFLTDSPYIVDLNNLAENNNLNKFLNIYLKIMDVFYQNPKKYEDYKVFLKLAHNYNINSKLYEDLILNNNSIDLIDVDNFYLFFEGEIPSKNFENPLEYVNNYSKVIIDEFSKSKNNELSLIEKKEIVIKSLFHYSINEFEEEKVKFLSYKILLEIANKTNNEQLLTLVSKYQILFDLFESIKLIDNLDTLNSMIDYLLEDNDLIIYFNKLTRDIRSDSKKILELEAMEELTNLSKLQNEDGLIDLTRKRYTLYAHAYSGEKLEYLIEPKKMGRMTICVSPITELKHNNLYSDELVVLYDKITSDSYVASSNKNMNSNLYIGENSINVNERLNINHKTIRESANRSLGHPETILYREGLIPSGILCINEEYLDECKMIAEELTNILRTKKGHENDTIYVVLSNELKNIIEDTKDEIIVENNLKSIESLKLKVETLNKFFTKRNLVQVELDNSMGGSHTIYHGVIDGKSYLIKPAFDKDSNTQHPYKSYSLLSSYRVQNLVYKIANNEDKTISKNEVEVKVITIPKDQIPGGSDEDVIAAALETKFNTSSYNNRKVFTTKEIMNFMLELIVDHLIINYDSKYENYLYDSNLNVYGIDKEQAMKFYDGHIIKIKTDIDIFGEFNPNGCNYIYPKVLNELKNCNDMDIKDSIIKLCLSVTSTISMLSDEEYINLFREYIDNMEIDKEHDKLVEQNKLIKVLLARKNNLYEDFKKLAESLGYKFNSEKNYKYKK